MTRVKINNYDEYCNEAEKPYILEQIKSPFRMIMSSKSSGGKTNLLLNLLLQPLVYYEKLIVFSTTLGQPKYKLLIDFFEELYQDELKKREKKGGGKMSISKQIVAKHPTGDFEKLCQFKQNENEPVERVAEFYENIDDLPDCESFNGNDKYTLIVLDDCMLEKNQSKLTKYFVKGRHNKLSVIYQTQKFSALPSALREQSSHYIFMGKQNQFLLNTISASVPIGLDYKSVKKLFNTAIQDNFDFIMINCTDPDPNKIIYRNLDEPINIDSVRIE